MLKCWNNSLLFISSVLIPYVFQSEQFLSVDPDSAGPFSGSSQLWSY